MAEVIQPSQQKALEKLHKLAMSAVRSFWF